MMKPASFLLLGWMFCFSASAAPPKMIAENRFTNPTDVIRHYAERDSWGFVWSGLSQDERTALTQWSSSPLPQTAYLIRKYEIIEPVKIAGDQARVEILYDVIAYTDGRGTQLPFTGPTKRVIYELKKTAGIWRISGPSPLQQPAFVRPDRYPLPLPELNP